uniref:Uncharacterized protein n=1 Tax=Salix viminalis TaxID=40686 RepID=A0A6N2L9G1_SALVM
MQSARWILNFDEGIFSPTFFFGLDAKSNVFSIFNSVGCCVDGCKIVEFWVDVALLNQLCVVLICGNSSRMPPENEEAILALHLAPLLETKFNPKKPNI